MSQGPFVWRRESSSRLLRQDVRGRRAAFPRGRSPPPRHSTREHQFHPRDTERTLGRFPRRRVGHGQRTSARCRLRFTFTSALSCFTVPINGAVLNHRAAGGGHSRAPPFTSLIMKTRAAVPALYGILPRRTRAGHFLPLPGLVRP